ncbi:MAG: CRISPR system precrRNA processing endoribonuclease RAMP protein Cas6 [Candidatus Tectomicrobia bacterium]|uniref:CRISPR system precrRNA processing endoribonuclease RAMP protein Cas6 n=1 Tax=Tectimicrobiota bacterium TaxID=2528274 RepID=A0A932GMF2_UNCTE|nr:CRISPR system precrRNA processing endoribonuclease RAMP protein Cas6 [Candidatus Tectomicrobia bacterium]
MLDGFRVGKFKFVIEAEERLQIPEYAGSALRGGFGHAFKRAVCVVRHGECDRCLVRQQCPYQYVFETPPAADTEMLRKYPAAPHPFVIEPPLNGRRNYAAGDSLEFGLTLIGRGIDYLPYFIVAFEELGRTGLGRQHGRYRLAEVRGETRNRGPDGWAMIYAGDRRVLRDDFRIRTGAEASDGHEHESRSRLFAVHDHPNDHAHDHDDDHDHGHDHGRLGIEFLTPTRLKFENRLASDLEFHILIRNLLRRLSTLSYFHCGQRLDLDFRGLIQRAQAVEAVAKDLRWVEWQRYSARQETTMLMGGFVGSAQFRGALDEFLPLLRLGEWVHVGKGTVFGLGLFKLALPDSR